MKTLKYWAVFLILLLAACSGPAETQEPALSPAISTPLPTSRPLPNDDLLFKSDGNGEPRSGGYWLLWNTCVEGNQSDTAVNNGGREAGWILMDDLLADPGILMGLAQVSTCEQAAAILQTAMPMTVSEDLQPYYRLAPQLLAAQLNLAVPAESCPAVEQAVRASQLLLLSAGYEGPDSALTPGNPQEDGQLADFLAEKLEQYNLGALCR